MSSTLSVGLLCAIGSAMFNGSFASLFKTRNMLNLSIHPIVFQLYVSGGVFLSSWCWWWISILFWSESGENDNGGGTESEGGTRPSVMLAPIIPMAIIAGFLLVIALSASFCAVDAIGVALAQGIWGGGAMLVAYLWGVLVFGQVPSHLGTSISGIILLILGVLMIALCRPIAMTLPRLLVSTLHLNRIRMNGMESRPLLGDVMESGDNVDDTSSQSSDTQFITGVLWASLVGMTGGSILAPMHYVPVEQQGVIFLPSFGTGAMLLSPILFLLCKHWVGYLPPLHLKEALGTGLPSGIVWNIGNLLSIIAISKISYGVAYPIMQCAILMSGIWGIYGFHENTERGPIMVFWSGGFLLLLGGLLLALAHQDG